MFKACLLNLIFEGYIVVHIDLQSSILGQVGALKKIVDMQINNVF